MSTSFTCKDVFLSFEDLKANIKKYEDANFVQLWMRDAKTINAARKSIPKRASIMAPQIKYSFIKYCCIHGGQKFKYKGFGKRQTSTYKKDCPFYLHFKASEDGQALILQEFNNTHNHEVSEIFYKHLPNQRRLPDYAIAKAETLLGLKANKKLLQRELLNETGKMITLRDLSNIAASAHKSDTRNDLTAFITTLKEKYSKKVVKYSALKKIVPIKRQNNYIADNYCITKLILPFTTDEISVTLNKASDLIFIKPFVDLIKKLRYPVVFGEDEMCKHFEKKIKARKQIRSKRNVESMWKNMKKCLVDVSDEVCGKSGGMKKWLK
ncbi:uncharacterized protein LOC136096699 [Hydra vulgaris]|uniref:uncharacterized protein LOC136096699 n=1 Tax=Hydra vulgaris TaxID=6087 RepID=UPI0032EA07F3